LSTGSQSQIVICKPPSFGLNGGMGKSSGKSKRSVIRIYEESPEIELLREQFPPRVNLQADKVSRLSREDLNQFLWLVRPEPKFRALAPAIGRLAAVCKEMQKPETGGPKIDWALLLRVADEIYRLGIWAHKVNPSLFENMGESDDAVSGNLEDANNKPPVNPILHHGSSAFPIYSILSNDIWLKGVIDAADRQDDPRMVAMRRLAGFAIMRNLELLDITRQMQTIEGEEESALKKITAVQQKFTDPVLFQSVDVEKDRYHFYFVGLEQAIREWSRDWDGIDEANQLFQWAQLPYPKFKEQCLDEYLHLQGAPGKEKVTLTKSQIKFKSVCRAFSSSVRKSKMSTSKSGSGERSREKENPGIQYRGLYRDIWLSEGDLQGNEFEIIPIDDATITDEYIETLIEPGDDVGEEIEDDRSDAPQLKWVAPQVGKSRLELERDSSYTQRFIAKLNQRLHWGTNVASWKEMELFKNYLDNLESALKRDNQDASKRFTQLSAIMALRLMYILGIDIHTALGAQVILREREGWRSGHSNFEVGDESSKGDKPKLGSQSLHLVKANAMPVNQPPSYIHLWRLSVPNYAWSELVNVQAEEYAPHLGAIVFQDLSGVAGQIAAASSQISETSSPIFAPSARLEIEKESQSLLTQFNREMDLYKAKRPLTMLKIREWSKHQMVGKNFDPRILDALDPYTPRAFKSDLYYYTHDAYKGTKQLGSLNSYLKTSVDVGDIQGAAGSQASKTSISDLFSQRTKLLGGDVVKAPFRGMRPSVVGATGLVAIDENEHPKALIEQIQELKKQIDIPRLANGRAQDYQQFCDAFNQFTLYCALWFACETSHRPHHLPYVDIAAVDPFLGLTRIGDKTNRAGDRLRVIWLSPLLQNQMWVYEQLRRKLLKKLLPDVTQHALYGELIWLEPVPVSKKQKSNKKRDALSMAALPLPLAIEKWSKTKMRRHFRGYIESSIVAQPNFHRKLMPALLKNRGMSQTDISTWLGHWQTGTAPFHQFGSHSNSEYIERIKNPIQKTIKGLGFELVTLAMPAWPKDQK